MNILFLHGLEGTPNGSKARFLKALGHNVIAPTLPKYDLFSSRKIAQEAINDNDIDLIVGSSRGGAIAAGINEYKNIPRILIAPAWKAFGIKPNVKKDVPVAILHSYDDDLVPYGFSEFLENKFNEVTLTECGACHRMSDPVALGELGKVVKRFEDKIAKKLEFAENFQKQVILNG